MSAAAGWLADPSERYQLRFWDGLAWTEHVSTNGAQAVDPLTTPLTAPPGGAVRGNWMDRAKAFAQQAADQASAAVDSASDAISKQVAPQQAAGQQPPSQQPSGTQPPQPGYVPGPVVSGPVQSRLAPTETRIADQLRRLAELRDEGVFTDEEFDAKKAQLEKDLPRLS